jgi:hypothetical protein
MTSLSARAFRCLPIFSWLARLSVFSIAIPFAAFLFASSAQGESYEPLANDIVHSDLPIFGRGGDDEWPQHISDGESIGCTSRVAFGDWAFREHGDDDEEPAAWYRFSNYGVFHCWANAYRAYERAGLDGAEHHPSFFVLLGSTRVDGRELELWTVQIGVRPGSQYLLLSRDPAKGLVDGFSVLQTQCPRGSVRDAGFLDSLITRYCAINSRQDLVRLARRMATLEPLGSLTLVPAGSGTMGRATD